MQGCSFSTAKQVERNDPQKISTAPRIPTQKQMLVHTVLHAWVRSAHGTGLGHRDLYTEINVHQEGVMQCLQAMRNALPGSKKTYTHFLNNGPVTSFLLQKKQNRSKTSVFLRIESSQRWFHVGSWVLLTQANHTHQRNQREDWLVEPRFCISKNPKLTGCPYCLHLIGFHIQLKRPKTKARIVLKDLKDLFQHSCFQKFPCIFSNIHVSRNFDAKLVLFPPGPFAVCSNSFLGPGQATHKGLDSTGVTPR